MRTVLGALLFAALISFAKVASWKGYVGTNTTILGHPSSTSPSTVEPSIQGRNTSGGIKEP